MSDSRYPVTEAGRRLFTDNEPGDMLESDGVTWGDVVDIEAEAWNVAIAAVEEAVGGMDGVLGSGASVSRNSVLRRIAALRKRA